jgi:hypothetical protein
MPAAAAHSRAAGESGVGAGGTGAGVGGTGGEGEGEGPGAGAGPSGWYSKLRKEAWKVAFAGISASSPERECSRMRMGW